ncbi:hypothetical protein BamMEX5DRAFT_6532 [Burkholderia ambifaria MEX-5]|uniref:Uncharacterized protein n=1 Tax=Burkholderia ambifaria MEX-5 TaxID=396597 RepID=B1TFG6_9BURK|nr:hypothetical protein BamMEX5DRAFT_6532 [Burkholderia ambifaria MEX-5]
MDDEVLDLRRQRREIRVRPVLDEHRRRRRLRDLCERIVVRQHDVHARDDDPVDFRQRVRQLLRHAVDEPHALLGRRRHEAVLLEQRAEIVVARRGQPARAQHFHRLDDLLVVDGERPRLAAVGRLLLRVDTVLQQRGHHLVAVALGEAAVQLLLAAGDERSAREQRGKPGRAAAAAGGDRGRESFHGHWFFIREPIASFVDVTTPIFACRSICIAVASADAWIDAANIWFIDSSSACWLR